MIETKGDDPFDWEIDRVVQEFCTSDRSWIPTPRAKLPDPAALAQKLRDGEYDGETLLATPEDDLWMDLGITKAKFKVSMRHAIGQFKSRSPKYKEYLASIKNQDADSDNDATETDPHQAFTPISDSAVPALAPATTQPIETVQNGAHATRVDEHPDEPPKKKKRLVVSAMVTTPRPSIANQSFNIAPIPTESDTIKHALSEAALVSPRKQKAETLPTDFGVDLKQCESSPGAYWGNGKLPKSGILAASSSTDDDVNFGWGIPRPIGKARKRYVADKMKAYLRRQKQQAVDQDDDVLPAYGESDDEGYRSELDKLIEEEEMEEEEEADQALGLHASEIDDLLEQMVDQCAADWHEQQLPKEKHKAYKMWDDARKHGTRGSTVKAMSEELWRGRTRLEKTVAEMKGNHYKNEAELLDMSDSLKPDVDKIEHIKWLIGIINSTDAPERVTRLKAPSQKRLKAKRKDEIDLWSGDEHEDEDDMRNFIIDDDPYEEADLEEQPLDPQEASQRGAGLGVEHFLSNASIDLGQSFESGTSGDIEMHDLTQIDESPFRGRDCPSIDLVTPTKPKRKSAKSLASGKGAAHDTSPASESFPLSDPKAIANEGSLHWEDRRDPERLIVTILWNQQKARRDDIFDNVIILQGEDDPIESFRKDYVEFACDSPKSSQDMAKGSREKNRYETAAMLTRLFGVYLNKYSGSTFLKLKRLDADLVEHIKAGMEHLPEFWAFLNLIAPYFGFTQTNDEPLSADEEYGTEGSDITPVAELKHLPSGSSQNVREKEKRRQREQQQRRLLLRQQVQGSQLSHEKSRLIINESKLEGQNLVYVHDHIAGRIKDHQIDGVRFMWDQILSDTNQGCLLAHTMGLGKTMQVITLLTAIQEAANSEDPKVSCQIPDNLKESRTLILCPAGLLDNWMDELLLWAPDHILGPLISVSAIMSEEERHENIQEWAEGGGVLVIGYTMLTQIAKRENLLTLILETPSIIVGDEAHNLKNEKSQRSNIASRFKTHSRLALTGSPLANNVDEYYAMIEWVAPGFLGEKRWFRSEYSIPIANGLYEDSTRADRSRAKIRLAALRKVVAPKMHRRTVGTLKDSLPPKTEYIVYLDIRSAQKAVYLSHLNVVNGAGGEQVPLMWALIRTLGLLLAHPLVLEKVLRQKLNNSWQSGFSSRRAGNKDGEEDSISALPLQVASTTLGVLTAQHGYGDLKSSFKMLALFKIIEETTKLGENLLVFSQSLPSLNYIENLCRQRRMVYQRLDGKTEVNKRQAHVKAFNEGSGQVYLISTTAGGVGLNIYGASRVVIFDFQHNPVHEQQAIGRAYRIGQTKPVVVYWLICDGTFEKTLHNQQVFKNQLASRVVDKKDPLPKATSLRHYFTQPEQVKHQDTAAYLGQDVVLDSLLTSDDIREGISSISTTETFEEEDTQKLDADEIAAAEQLAQQISRKINAAEDSHPGMPSQPWEQVIPPVPVPPGFPQPTGGHRYEFGQPHGVVQNGFEQMSSHQHNINGPADPNSLHNDLAPRALPRDDPFMDSGTVHQKRGAEGGQSLSRAATEAGMMPVTTNPALSQALPFDSGRALPQGMSPVAMGGVQNRPVSSSSQPRHIASRESMEPMGMSSLMKSKTIVPSSTGDSGKTRFLKNLTTQGNYTLIRQGPAIVEQINQHIKGGTLQQTDTWNKLKMLVQGRPDRVNAILNGSVSPKVLASAGDPKAGLENLLDGRSSVPQSQDEGGMKDPDHTRRMLQRSISEDVLPVESNSQKARDLAAIREVYKKRQSKPQDGSQQPRVKVEKNEKRRRTMPTDGSGMTFSDPFVIDDD
ncbi:hypothetical protein diail_11318 [Diaporthe ilicicola]|nr:hypothetical protein diail_11318 [Diaporthe ilicicola]